MTKVRVLFPWLLAAFPSTFLYLYNPGLSERSDWLIALGLSEGALSLLWLLSLCVYRNLARSAVFSALSVLLFFSYGHVVNGLTFMIGNYQNGLALIWCCALWIFLALFCKKSTWNFSKISYVLNGLGFALVFLLIVDAWGFSLRLSSKKSSQVVFDSSTKREKLPDIIFILLDGYGRADILKSRYHYDNSDFVGFLKERGFAVASKSCANYCQTSLSLAATFSMNYLEDSLAAEAKNKGDRRPLVRRLKDNAVLDHLKQKGYEILSADSGYVFTGGFGQDLYQGLYSNVLLDLTPLPVLFPPVKQSLYERHRRRVLETFRVLKKLPFPSDRPRFIFAHLLCPHPPFVFDAKGDSRAIEGFYSLSDGSHLLKCMTPETYRKQYIAQLQFLNIQVKTVVEALLKHSKGHVVVIVQSDHGPGSGLDWTSLEHTDAQERFGVLNALYWPGIKPSDLPQDLSLVNTFRRLFGHLDAKPWQRLEDHSYYSTWDEPYDFISVMI